MSIWWKEEEIRLKEFKWLQEPSPNRLAGLQRAQESYMSYQEAVKIKDGTITLDEFIDYYSDVSQSIPGDEMFIQMMEQTLQCRPEHENTKEV